MAYKEHRKILCKTIKLAKKSFYGRKFENFKADPRKTWSLINDLRGKGKTPPKSSFVIEGERINCRRIISSNQMHFAYTRNRRETTVRARAKSGAG